VDPRGSLDTGVEKILAPAANQNTDHPASSLSLYLLRYPGSLIITIILITGNNDDDDDVTVWFQ
jgi:hypothetical protein